MKHQILRTSKIRNVRQKVEENLCWDLNRERANKPLYIGDQPLQLIFYFKEQSRNFKSSHNNFDIYPFTPRSDQNGVYLNNKH